MTYCFPPDMRRFVIIWGQVLLWVSWAGAAEVRDINIS